MGVFLGIDIGTSATKALAINARGKILAEATSSYHVYHPRPLWSEQDPEDWWQATIRTVRAVVRRSKAKRTEVKAIGLSGQMHGAVFLDRKQQPLRRAILWNDQRTARECQEIEKQVGGRRRLIRLVANPARTGFTAPKIIWLRRHEPRRFERTEKILLPKDEVRRRLTGEFATDVSDASGTLLLDVAKRRWSRTLLSKLDLDQKLFPQVCESEEITGRLTTESAKILGLSADCVVVAGAGDCAAGAIGNGIVGRGVLSTSIGTSGVVFVHLDKMAIDPEGRLHSFCHAVRSKWHMMGVSLSAGGSLQWFRNQLCSAEMSFGNRQKMEMYDRLTHEAAEVPPGGEGLFFLPFLAGERTPHADADARGCFVGLTLRHHRGHLVRAILEGVTYSLGESLAIIKSLGIPVREIRVSGGGSKSALWRQIQADCFGQQVRSVANDEGPAYGVALLAAVASGEFENIEEACAATVRVTRATLPDPRGRRYYRRAFPIYQQLYHSLKDDFKAIATLK